MPRKLIYHLFYLFDLQIGLFDGSDSVQRAAVTECDEIYVLMKNKEFGKFRPDLECSLVPLHRILRACDYALSLLIN